MTCGSCPDRRPDMVPACGTRPKRAACFGVTKAGDLVSSGRSTVGGGPWLLGLSRRWRPDCAMTGMGHSPAVGLGITVNDGLPVSRMRTPDPEPTVEVCESSHSPQPPPARKPPFDFQQCYSCLTGSFEGRAARVWGMGSVGYRPEPDGSDFPPKPTLTWGRSTVTGHSADNSTPAPVIFRPATPGA